MHLVLLEEKPENDQNIYLPKVSISFSFLSFSSPTELVVFIIMQNLIYVINVKFNYYRLYILCLDIREMRK